MFLSEYVNKVYLIHRRDSFRGEEHIYNQLKNKENVEIILNSNVVALKGDGKLEAIDIKNAITNEERTLQLDGIFIAIGQMPDNEAFKDLVQLDDKGYIIAGEDCCTNIPGIFAAGDCRTKSVRQLATAAADGAVAALKASEI